MIWASVFSASVFAVSDDYPGAMLEPKWYGAVLVAMAGGLLWIAYCHIARLRVFSMAFSRGMEVAALIVCSSQALFMLLIEIGICPTYGRYAVGSFGNAAGFASCMVLSLPVGMRMLRSGSFPSRAFFVACKLLCVLGILFSGSRIGVVCAMVAGLLVFHLHRKAKAFFGLAVVLVAVTLALCVKAGSTQGRWFIACRTAELIGRSPWLGHGAGGFDANYMDVQAGYFAENTDSGYALYAGNVYHPLNEYMMVCADYGLAGLLAVVALMASCLWHSSRHQSYYSCMGRNILVLLGMFSLFSYPMIYPFSWIMLFAGISLIFNGCLRHCSRVVCVLFTVGSLAFVFPVVMNAGARKELKSISEKASIGLAGRMLPRYASLYPMLRGDWRFMYSYSVALYDAGRFAESLSIADECAALRSDYDLCLLQGSAYRQLGEFKRAMRCYQRAHWMVPSRFVPLYEMYNVAAEGGDTATSRSLAREIQSKPVKVPSCETLEIIEEVKRREEGNP